MKGSVTIFLAMSLSLFMGFILFLISQAVINGEKHRFECGADTGMNAVLSEFHTELFERYGLLYVDASYRGDEPSVEKVEDRLRFYLQKNTSFVYQQKNAPWGQLTLNEVEIPSFETAAAGCGASMRNQAVLFVRDAGLKRNESDAAELEEEIRELDAIDAAGEFDAVMGQLSEMELPMILNKEGEWEEVPLSNPADWAYGLMGNSLFYLGEIDAQELTPVRLELGTYISHRGAANTDWEERERIGEKQEFLTYLFEKLGHYGNGREGSLLCCQLEYVAEGRASDLENAEAVAERILRWRFADNLRLALSDDGLWGQASEAAGGLRAVQLKREFEHPVTMSILYACAYLESLADIRTIYSGGCIPLKKSTHQMSVEKLLEGVLDRSESSGEFTYGHYLAGMLACLDEEQLNLRTMDIMEMDIRYESRSMGFCMDWCIERYEAQVSVKGSAPGNYQIRRKYGYF